MKSLLQKKSRLPRQTSTTSLVHWLNSFGNRVAILFAALLLTLGGILAAYLYQTTSTRLTESSGRALAAISQSVANMLASNLREREREIILLSQRRALFNQENTQDLQHTLNQIQNSYEHYAWIGYANDQGRVVVAGNGVLQGADVSTRPWYVQGSEGPFVGDVHNALLLAEKLPRLADGSLPRFVDFAAPVTTDQGHFKGVIATHSNWAWVSGVLKSALPNSVDDENIDIFILNKNNGILYPNTPDPKKQIPSSLPASSQYDYTVWPDNKTYLTSLTNVASPISNDLDWKIVVRQPEKIAMAAVYEMRNVLLLSGLLMSIICLFLTYKLAHAFSRPVERLAATAIKIRDGNRQVSFEDSNKQLNEIASLSSSLQNMMVALLQREQSLVQINTTLEAKVAERTQALQSANRELEKLALQDPLTNCFNRLALDEAMERTFIQAKRDNQPLSAIMMDADHFKKVNDNYGHKTGDEVLKELVAIMLRHARQNDIVARYGGEEFAVILPQTDAHTAQSVAESIRKDVEQTTFGEAGSLTISSGIATIQSEDTSADAILNRADDALYCAKQNGRNQVVVH